ncbi:hypothetical protein ACLOJK_013131 [Asimina triloba]
MVQNIMAELNKMLCNLVEGIWAVFSFNSRSKDAEESKVNNDEEGVKVDRDSITPTNV